MSMRILVGSDLSPASDEAVVQSLGFARATGNELGLCHVLPEPQLRTLFPQEHARDVEALLALQPRVADALRAQAERLFEGEALPFHVFIEQGSAHAELTRRSEEWNAGLIVVGHHKQTGVGRLFSSSVAEHVVRYAPCSVLVARKSAQGVILVATDLSDPAQLAIEAAAREATRRARALVVMHATETFSRRAEPAMALLGAIAVVEPSDIAHERDALAKQIIEGALERFGAKAEIQLVDGDPASEILRLVAALPVELLVVGTRGHSSIARVTLGSVATKVVHAAACSVLAVRPGFG